MQTIILSDLHLGARNSRSDLLLDILGGDFDRLVLNGDVVDSPDARRFQAGDWEVVARLRRVARRRELVVVRGNHDILPGPDNPRGSTRFLTSTLGVPVVESHDLLVGRNRYLVIHGDQFDNTMNLTWVGDAADWVYRGMQRVSRPLAHFAKHASKHVCGVAAAVRNGGLAFARRHGYDGLIAGHTHFHHAEFGAGGHYLNTGCWVDSLCTFVRVAGGAAAVVTWNEQTTRTAGQGRRITVPAPVPCPALVVGS